MRTLFPYTTLFRSLAGGALLSVYAKCTDGERATYNDRISSMLNG
jgi:hypothetical protein